ncbi:MAG: site-specific integrase [Cellulomonadaceae bacterium]
MSHSPRLDPGDIDAVLHRFAAHLGAQRGLAGHTVQAYCADVGDLTGFARRRGLTRLDEIDLRTLRAWLGAMSARGLARATIARRGASARAFFDWATRAGLVVRDQREGVYGTA